QTNAALEVFDRIAAFDRVVGFDVARGFLKTDLPDTRGDRQPAVDVRFLALQNFRRFALVVGLAALRNPLALAVVPQHPNLAARLSIDAPHVSSFLSFVRARR